MFSDGLLARKIAPTHGMWFMPEPVSIWNIHAGGLSRATALDRDKALDALDAMPRLIGADPDFPTWYAELFQRRWRFGSARLALDEAPPGPQAGCCDGTAHRGGPGSDPAIAAVSEISPRPARDARMAHLALKAVPAA